ncbi:MAG: zinc-dependent peptidase [Chlorobi bacterium]|nr:zinc-dependent peptidase [Chlorobiota bacterium]
MVQQIIFVFAVVFVVLTFYLVYRVVLRPKPVNEKILNEPFPRNWRKILQQRVLFYRNLPDERKKDFEERVKRFLAEKSVHGVDTVINDTDKLLVAASAIIPVFNFPYFRYPNVREVLIYPGSFDEKFRTDNQSEQRNILGMVGDGFMNGVVVLSKPDLEAAFDGMRHRKNVGIHEFVHLIDKADGAVDGVPEVLFNHSYTLPWLKEIRREMRKIRDGHSDINPYALTNDAEFLAVVSEYFFDNPEKLKHRHAELYRYLTEIFQQKPDDYV